MLKITNLQLNRFLVGWSWQSQHSTRGLPNSFRPTRRILDNKIWLLIDARCEMFLRQLYKLYECCC